MNPLVISRPPLETALDNASSKTKKGRPLTSGVTAVQTSETIGSSLRDRPQSIPSLADLSARDQLTFSSIEEWKVAKIKTAEAKASNAKMHLASRQMGTGMMVPMLGQIGPIEAEKKRAISEIEAAATEQKNTLLAKVKPAFAETDLSPNQQKVYTIFDKLAEELSEIEKETDSKIQAVENKANISQSLLIRPATGLAVPLNIEEKKRSALDEIEKTAVHQKNLLLIKAKGQLLSYQQAYFESLFKIYSGQLSEGSRTSPNSDDLESCRQIVIQTFEQEALILEALTAPKPASAALAEAREAETLTTVVNLLASNDTVRLQPLRPFVEHSINSALSHIEETSNFLATLRKVKGNRFLNTTILTSLHQEFAERHANYLLAETLPNSTAGEVALNNASYIRTTIEEIAVELNRTYSAQQKVAPQDQLLVEQKISLLRTAIEALASALQAYEQIADDSSLRIKTPPLNILSKLREIPEEENDHVFLGRRGEMELVDTSTSSDLDTERLREGFKLAELAIFRDFGIRGLRRFRAYFHNEIMALDSPGAQNSLTVGKLRAFAYEEDQRNPRAFYLSSAHSISELIFSESDVAEDSKLLKSDKSAFNPFSKLTPGEATLSENQERAEGIKATRVALKEFFKDLPPERRQLILNEFDKKFTKTETETQTPLTVGELRSFIKAEIEKLTSLNFDITGPFLYSLVWQVGVAAAWTFIMHSNLSYWSVMAISLSIGVGHDLTSYWRQLRPEEEN